MTIDVKICGISDAAGFAAASAGGAAFAGFVFYPPSPRFVEAETVRALLARKPAAMTATGVFVDPDDALLDQVLTTAPLDLLQLHGRESPARVAEIRRRSGLPVMKAIPVAAATDLDAVAPYEAVADRLLFDAKPVPGDSRPGGNARSFDWGLLAGRRWALPWVLSGGLTAACLAPAVAASGARAVDVSSGVETRPGHKDPALIAAFLEAAAKL